LAGKRREEVVEKSVEGEEPQPIELRQIESPSHWKDLVVE
jgi:hypothetical protein